MMLRTVIWSVGWVGFLLGLFLLCQRWRIWRAAKRRAPSDYGTWSLLFCPMGEKTDRVLGEFTGTREEAWDAAQEAVGMLVMSTGNVVVGRYGVSLKQEADR